MLGFIFVSAKACLARLPPHSYHPAAFSFNRRIIKKKIMRILNEKS